MPSLDIGVDIGGTFTDVVARAEDGTLRLAKIPSNRAKPGAPIRTVLQSLLPEWGLAPSDVRRFVHGTTVATNAVLERKGAVLGILATEGFTDVIEIGRQNRTQIYELLLKPETPNFLAPGARRKGVREAVSPTGEMVTPLDEGSLARSVDELLAQGVNAIAICFLFSFANPANERKALDVIRKTHPDLVVSLSSDVDPAFREYERTCVTAFDAYIKPVLDRYLAEMEQDLSNSGVTAPLQIMRSRGGISSSRSVRHQPIRLFLSGPAAGVVGAQAIGASVGAENLITLDVGGTSSDIALIAKGQPIIRSDGYLDGYRIRVPMVDVNAIGAGGGSIAWIDAGGGLRVGPQSAGADPGPACYGRGGVDATVTDASIVLGFLNPAYFAGGTLRLDPALAAKAVEERVAKPLGLSLTEAALGIHRVVNAQMAEGIRLVSIRRGVDPRKFAIVPFGGAGALHATALARELGIETVLIPRYPGVLSAAGLLSAPIEHEASIAFLERLGGADPGHVIAQLNRLKDECAARMSQEALAGASVDTHYFADLCYVGQAYHLEVPLDIEDPSRLLERAFDSFHTQHDQVYGHATRNPARFVNLRVVQQAHMPQTSLTAPRADAAKKIKGARKVHSEAGKPPVAATIYDRDGLLAGDRICGPAIIEQADTTSLIEAGWEAVVHDTGALLLQRKG